MTGVSECSQQRGNLKDDGYIISLPYQQKTSAFIALFYCNLSHDNKTFLNQILHEVYYVCSCIWIRYFSSER
ncbi:MULTISPECIES: hypothetical protein [Photorhabdus]|uniref:Uncharacterized protein n=1 Tax=Photorhabdus bodei TaxID=2029681 RepID=A0AAW6BFX2_9GAMM|nr:MULTISPECIES: hypothetical protein [Photorhabdus]MCC8376343.1 hypothetical protein [Photorhabdus bodei]MCC8466619.1 hypothetical protein [Photorhabdus bodei]MCT8352476.1 hypothetical protein [Photorhabdus kayaii]MDB6366474.1 hypothetical protein [Photorhabdus bodei]MDB6371686.1 hypothetical protein [Photorhabdus bodei]